MVRTVLAVAAVGFLVVLHAVGLKHLDSFRSSGPSLRLDYVLPGPILRITALEFDGLAADLAFLKATTFYGERTYKRIRLGPDDWDQLTQVLQVATDLDPRFLDPYHFGEMALTWEAGRVPDANRLLEKALRYRGDDWVVPYYLGFNYFYFLHDSAKGGEYLMMASRLPESQAFIGLLASRLSTQSGRTEAAVVFLDELARSTSDPTLRRQIELRLEAVKGIAVIERAVTMYRERYGNSPERIEQLTDARILRTLPTDPYGGQFFLDAQGRVQTTSRLVAHPIAEKHAGEANR
jgi:hypothetical protein